MAYSSFFHTRPLPLLPRTPSPLKKYYSGAKISKATFDVDSTRGSTPSPTSSTGPIPIPVSSRVSPNVKIPEIHFSPPLSPSPLPSQLGSEESFSVPSETGDDHDHCCHEQYHYHDYEYDHDHEYGAYVSVKENENTNHVHAPTHTFHPTLLVPGLEKDGRRSSVLSDSEISVLDLGPSLSPTGSGSPTEVGSPISPTGDAEGVPAPSVTVGMAMSPVGPAPGIDGGENGPFGFGFGMGLGAKEKSYRGLSTSMATGLDGSVETDTWDYGYGCGRQYDFDYGEGDIFGYGYGGDGSDSPHPLLVMPRLERNGDSSGRASHEHRRVRRPAVTVESPVLRPLRTTRKDKARRAVSSWSRRALGL